MTWVRLEQHTQLLEGISMLYFVQIFPTSHQLMVTMATKVLTFSENLLKPLIN